MSEPLLQLTALNAHYADFQALYGVDMHVNAGEVVAIIGANGAGKSTLMRSICGLLQNRPEAVRLRGAAIGALRADQMLGPGGTWDAAKVWGDDVSAVFARRWDVVTVVHDGSELGESRQVWFGCSAHAGSQDCFVGGLQVLEE